MRSSGLVLIALACCAPAAAADEPRADPAKKRVCRPAAPTIGSHIKRAKVCRTAAEWEEIDRARRAADITVKPAQPEPWERTRPQ